MTFSQSIYIGLGWFITEILMCGCSHHSPAVLAWDWSCCSASAWQQQRPHVLHPHNPRSLAPRTFFINLSDHLSMVSSLLWSNVWNVTRTALEPLISLSKIVLTGRGSYRYLSQPSEISVKFKISVKCKIFQWSPEWNYFDISQHNNALSLHKLYSSKQSFTYSVSFYKYTFYKYTGFSFSHIL